MTEAPSTASATGIRCGGITRSNLQCSRTVRKLNDPRLSRDASGNLVFYCFQHPPRAPPVAFRTHKDHKLVYYDGVSTCLFAGVPMLTSAVEWVSKHLQPETKVLLRKEMEKPYSDSEELGYVYAFEIHGAFSLVLVACRHLLTVQPTDKNDPSFVHIKVGRTVRLTRRLEQWSRQCSSKPQILRGFWPPSSQNATGSMLDLARLDVGLPGPSCHRLERLIHIELADLVKQWSGIQGNRSQSRGHCVDCKCNFAPLA